MKYASEGILLQSQSFSVNDGEGIRNTIFLAGCPLRCQWCANPETWTLEPKLAFYEERCTQCGSCQKVCPQGISPNVEEERRISCDGCGLCVNQCPQKALSILCTESAIEPILAKIERERIFFQHSNGGVTFSGGEPTFQQEFLRNLTNEFYRRGISIWMETCGYFNWDSTKDILLKMDHLLYDIKCMDESLHKQVTGVSNQLILENCCKVAQEGIPLTIRIPLIKEVNCNPDNLIATAQFVMNHVPGGRIELLPYHDFGKEKYQAIGMREDFKSFTTPTWDEVAAAKQLLIDHGIKIVEYK